MRGDSYRDGESRYCIVETSIKRKKTRPVFLGNVQVGGNAPVVVQSMTCTDTRDIRSTVRQIKNLEEAGCQIVRVAVPDNEAADTLSAIKKQISIPLIADIIFIIALPFRQYKPEWMESE
jgi:(E)-4-hydroxy-3-methylbut-2-enyl-diphosphate synthase